MIQEFCPDYWSYIHALTQVARSYALLYKSIPSPVHPLFRALKLGETQYTIEYVRGPLASGTDMLKYSE